MLLQRGCTISLRVHNAAAAATVDVCKSHCREQCRQVPEESLVEDGLSACRAAAIDVIAPTVMFSRDTGPIMAFACQARRDSVLDIEKRRT